MPFRTNPTGLFCVVSLPGSVSPAAGPTAALPAVAGSATANQSSRRIYTDFSSFCDPTHRNQLNSFSFRYFGEDHAGFGYYSQVRFREISVRVRLLALWRWLGFEFLVNRFPRYRRFWEHYLCYVVRGKVMEFEFEVVK
jgi:hypothetical protein